jgi:hypothetical protein
MIGWIRDLFSGRRGELLALVESLEAEADRLRGEITTLRTLCRALRDVNADLDRRLLEASR